VKDLEVFYQGRIPDMIRIYYLTAFLN